jgi:hypothetical protein
MMDADFEYGLQGTKWQSYVDVRKFPSFFEVPGTDYTFSNVVSDGAAPASNITISYAATVQGSAQALPPVGSFISMFGLSTARSNLADRAEGYFIVNAINSGAATANYLAKSWVPAGNIQSNFNFSRKANVYNSGTCVIPTTNIWADGTPNLQVFTSNSHGLLPGTPLTANCLAGVAQGGGNLFGTFYVSNVTSSNSFNIVANALTFGIGSSGTAGNYANLSGSNTTLYVAQFGSQQHRPYDGGVLLSTLSPCHGSTVIRQSKKAFRYQSGKGILFSSGTLFCPQLDIASINVFGITTTTAGSVVTGTTQPTLIQVVSSTGFQQGQTIASYLGSNLGTVTISSVPDSTHINITWTNSTQALNIPVGTTVTVLPTGSNIQITTDLIHGIPQAGATAIVRNFTTTQFNGTYTITGVTDSRTVNVQSLTALSTTLYNLGDQPRLVLAGWHGSSVRAGCFEDPNGLFWEYDGQTLAVVRRQSTFQTAGYVTVTPQSQILLGTLVSGATGAITLTPGTGTATATISPAIIPGDTQAVITIATTGTGTATNTIQQYMQNYIPGIGYVWVVGVPDFAQITIGFLPTTYSGTPTAPLTSWTLSTTRFQDQLKVNDRFTVRGMVHQVTSIQGQGVLTFNPPYRGTLPVTAATPVKCCKIKELRVPQSQFNRDTIDGKGPSGYKVDLTRQQMIGLQYTWYGAGFVDFMIRGPDGNWIMCHRIKNNNVNDEAYMRSGNLPVRYELTVESRASVSTLASNLNTTATTITINDPTTPFPPSNATLLIDNELISYTGTTPNSFTGCTRAASLNYVISDTPRTFTGQNTGLGQGTTHLANTSVNLISCSATPTLTHWGSSFLTDGQFDFERGYYFNYSNTSVVLGPYVVPGQNPLTIPIQSSTAGFSAPGATPIPGISLSSVTPLSSLGGSTTSFTGIGNVVFTATTGVPGSYAFGLGGGGGGDANCVVVFNSTVTTPTTYTAIPGPYPGAGLANIISVGSGYTSSTLSQYTNVHVLGGISIAGPASLGSATFGGTSPFTQAQSTALVTNPGTMFKITGGGSTVQANCFIPLLNSGATATVLSSSNAFITYPGAGFTSTTSLPTPTQIIPTFSAYSFPVNTGVLINNPTLTITSPVAPGPYILTVTSSGGTGGNVYFIVGTNGTTVSSPTILTGGTGFGASTLTTGLTFSAVPGLTPTITNARYSNATVSSVGSSIAANFVGTFPQLTQGAPVYDNTTGLTAVVSTTIPTTTTSPVQIFVNPSTSSFAVGDSVTFSGGQGTGTVTAINTTNPSVTVTASASTITAGTTITDTTSGLSVLSSSTVTVSLASSATSAFAIRLAPSVTNGFVGDIGQKELLNRAQLLLQKLEVTSPVNMQTIGYLNPTGVYFNPANWVNINSLTNGTQPSFAQYYPGNAITGVPQPGERIFQTIVQAENQNNLDLSSLKELTNGCIGGNQPFPDGPDVLLIYCTNLTTTSATVQVNLFWSEAQA